jgi:hypothetical protein
VLAASLATGWLSRFRHPTGQRKGRRGKTTSEELKEIAAAKVAIRDGNKTRKASLLAANPLA